jgi:hypothetical protein
VTRVPRALSVAADLLARRGDGLAEVLDVAAAVPGGGAPGLARQVLELDELLADRPAQLTAALDRGACPRRDAHGTQPTRSAREVLSFMIA